MLWNEAVLFMPLHYISGDSHWNALRFWDIQAWVSQIEGYGA